MELISAVAEGALPMRLEDWKEELSFGWAYCREDSSSSRVKVCDPAHLDKMKPPNSAKLEEPLEKDANADHGQAGAQGTSTHLHKPSEPAVGPHNSKTDAEPPPTDSKLHDPADVNTYSAKRLKLGDGTDVKIGGDR